MLLPQQRLATALGDRDRRCSTRVYVSVDAHAATAALGDVARRAYAHQKPAGPLSHTAPTVPRLACSTGRRLRAVEVRRSSVMHRACLREFDPCFTDECFTLLPARVLPAGDLGAGASHPLSPPRAQVRRSDTPSGR